MKLFDEPIGIKSIEPYYGLITSATDLPRKEWARKHIINTKEGKSRDSKWIANYLSQMTKMANAKGIENDSSKPKAKAKKNKIPRVIPIQMDKTKRVLAETAKDSKLVGSKPVKIIK